MDSLKQTALTVQGKEYSVRNLTDLTLNAGEYVGIKMTALTSASAITAEGTGLDQLAVQYSTNGVQWSGQADFTAPAVLRYIRIVNNTDSAVTCDLEKLGVTAENLKMNPSVLEHSFTNALKEGNGIIFLTEIVPLMHGRMKHNRTEIILSLISVRQLLCMMSMW